MVTHSCGITSSVPPKLWFLDGTPRPPSIIMQTREGRWVFNSQIQEISAFEESYLPLFKRDYPDAEFRTGPNPVYNCHGLTFAARRTGIHETSNLLVILDDDRYAEVTLDHVLPGDVILYFSADGDIEHSGVVISNDPGNFKVPKVLSKWGKYFEALHPFNRCPYDFQIVKYYRVMS